MPALASLDCSAGAGLGSPCTRIPCFNRPFAAWAYFNQQVLPGVGREAVDLDHFGAAVISFAKNLDHFQPVWPAAAPACPAPG